MAAINTKSNSIIGLQQDMSKESGTSHSPMKNKKPIITKKIKKAHKSGENNHKQLSTEDEYLTIPLSSSTNPDFLFKSHARTFIFDDSLYSYPSISIAKMLIDVKTWIGSSILPGISFLAHLPPASDNTATGSAHDNSETSTTSAGKPNAAHSSAINNNNTGPRVSSWAERKFFFNQNLSEQGADVTIEQEAPSIPPTHAKPSEIPWTTTQFFFPQCFDEMDDVEFETKDPFTPPTSSQNGNTTWGIELKPPSRAEREYFFGKFSDTPEEENSSCTGQKIFFKQCFDEMDDIKIEKEEPFSNTWITKPKTASWAEREFFFGKLSDTPEKEKVIKPGAPSFTGLMFFAEQCFDGMVNIETETEAPFAPPTSSQHGNTTWGIELKPPSRAEREFFFKKYFDKQEEKTPYEQAETWESPWINTQFSFSQRFDEMDNVKIKTEHFYNFSLHSNNNLWWWNYIKSIKLTNGRFSPEELKESLNKTLNYLQSIQWSNDRFSPEEIGETLQAWLQHLEELSSYWPSSA